MKIKYHVALDWTENEIKIMNKYGLYPSKGHNAIQIDDYLYQEIKHYIIKWRGSEGIRYPEFTSKEIKEAILSAKIGSYEHGYPMPDLNFGYKELTYDLSNYCEVCGIGLLQKDAFRIKSEPASGKKLIFSLGWIYDELFVNKKIYNEIFKPLGIDCKEVLRYGKETPFENTVQLMLPETSEKLEIDDWPIEICPKCTRTKYQPMPQGFFPLYKNIIGPIFKSYDYFGSGASATKRIFVNKDLREKLLTLKEKPTWYVPAKN